MTNTLIPSVDIAKLSIRLKNAEDDIFFFANNYLSHYFSFPTPKIHLDWVDYMTDYQRIILACPRGHSKTTWFSFVYPLWCILFKKKKFIVLLSDTNSQATAFLGAIIEELETNTKIIRDFGKIAGYVPPSSEEKQKWTAKEIVTLTGARVVAKGFADKLRGMKHNQYRPDLIICDDVENDVNVQSPDQRTKYRNIFNKSIMNLGDEKTQIIVVGTILHFDSLLINLCKEPPEGYKTHVYRAIENGRALWEERYNLEWLAIKKKEIGSIAFESEYMNNPLDEGSQILKPKAYYDSVDFNYLDFYCYVDLAISEKETADYFAVVTLGRHKDTGKIYVIDTYRIRTNVNEQMEILFRLHTRFKYARIGIETVAYQKAFFQLVQKEGLSRKEYLPLVECIPDKDKVRRAIAITPFIENETILFNSQHLDFLSEVVQFPKADHDDFVDSFVGGVNLIMQNASQGSIETRKGISNNYGTTRLSQTNPYSSRGY
jgi:predicted phage terminase large subunit-like protein